MSIDSPADRPALRTAAEPAEGVRVTGAHVPRPDIQGLRAVAVGLVVLNHSGVGHVGGGYVGVDVFFVISGFLITSLLKRELARTGRISVRAFYARRALRLLPASTLVVVATLAGSWLCLSKIRFTEYAGDALSSALYAVNFRLAGAGTDYLDADSPPSPFQHFWSLAVEEQFYAVWPLLLLACWRVGRRLSGGPKGDPYGGRQGGGRGLRRALGGRPAAVVLGALCLGSFWLSVRLTAGSPSWAYFGSQARLWELGAGALLALGAGRLDRMPAGFAAVLSWAGLGCVLLAALRYDEGTPFPGRYALLPVLGAVLVLAGGCVPARYGAGLVLGWRPAVWVGGLSYGWYLWHWPLLVVGPAALERPAGVLLALELDAVALGLAWLTSRLVENSVRFHAAFRGRPWRALRLGGGLSAGAAALALVAGLFPPAISSGRPAPDLGRELTAAADPAGRLGELLAASDGSLPSNLTPALEDVKPVRSAVYRDGCHVDYASTSTPDCVYGDPDSDTVVVLFGDSHAAQWTPALDRLARERHWKLVSLTKASCKTAGVTIVNAHRPYSTCDTWRRRTVARINALHPDLVVVSSSEAGDPVRPAADALGQWTEGYREVLASLASSGARVAALLDTPWPDGDAVDCAASYPLHLDHCASSLAGAVHDPLRRRALRAGARAAGAEVIDPAPWLCAADGTCPVLAGNTLVYRDDSHLAETFAQDLAPVLGGRLAPLLA